MHQIKYTKKLNDIFTAFINLNQQITYNF